MSVGPIADRLLSFDLGPLGLGLGPRPLDRLPIGDAVDGEFVKVADFLLSVLASGDASIDCQVDGPFPGCSLQIGRRL